MRPIQSEVQHIRDHIWKVVDRNVKNRDVLGQVWTLLIRGVHNTTKARIGNSVNRQLIKDVL